MVQDDLVYSIALMEGRKIDYRCKFLLLRLIVVQGIQFGDRFTLEQCTRVSINKEKQTRILLGHLVNEKVIEVETGGREYHYTLGSIKTSRRKSWFPIIKSLPSNLWFIKQIVRNSGKQKSDSTSDNRSVVLTVCILLLLADSYHIVRGIGRARLRKLIGVSQIKNKNDLQALTNSGFVRHSIPGIKKSLILGEQATRYQLDIFRVEKALGIQFQTLPQHPQRQVISQFDSHISRLMTRATESVKVEFHEDKLSKRLFDKLAAEFIAEGRDYSVLPPAQLLTSIDAFILIFKEVSPHGIYPVSHLIIFTEELSVEIVRALKLSEMISYCSRGDEGKENDTTYLDDPVYIRLADTVEERISTEMLPPLCSKLEISSYEKNILSRYLGYLITRFIDTVIRTIAEEAERFKLQYSQMEHPLSKIWLTYPRARLKNEHTVLLNLDFG